jgi:hypothetical protein
MTTTESKRTFAIAAGGGGLAVVILVLAWNGALLGAGAAVPRSTFAERFDVAKVRQPRRLASLEPELGQPVESEHMIERVSPNAAYDIFAARRLRTAAVAAQAAKRRVASATGATAQADDSSVASTATAADFLAPDVSQLVAPAAALSLLTLSVAELARRDHSSTQWAYTSNGQAAPLARTSSIDQPLKLPGPFHVFFTTGPAGDVLATPSNGNATANGGNGGVVGNTVGAVGSTVGALGSTVGALGGTVGSTVGTVGSTVNGTVGTALGLLKH